ncbi:hypothetical protein AVEN_118949-1, partial [Araneus ventricosus]
LFSVFELPANDYAIGSTFIVQKIIFSPVVASCYVTGLESPDQTNARFTLLVLSIIALKVSFRTKSKKVYNFVIDFFPVSCTVFEIETLTQLFIARWRCSRSHRVAYGHFTIPRHHVYGNICRRSQVNVG